MSFEQQLSNREDPPLSGAVRQYLISQGLEPDESGLAERFVWEVRLGKTPSDALQSARFAQAIAATPARSVAEAIQVARHRVQRGSVRLEPGEHRTVEEAQLSVLNLAESPLWAAEGELLLAREQMTSGLPLTAVLEDEGQPTARRVDDKGIVWKLPRHNHDGNKVWNVLADAARLPAEQLPVWTEAFTDHRYLVAGPEGLPSEHQVRALRVRDKVAEILTFYSYGTPEALHPLSLEEAFWVLSLVEDAIRFYTQQPRIILSFRDLSDFGPAEEWQQGYRSLKALINLVTGDDHVLGAALGATDSLRVGQLAFTGDPEKNEGDLLALTMPASPYYLVLRPEVMRQALFLTGLPEPTSDLPVPQRRHGFYNTLASYDQVIDMLRTRLYLDLCPVMPQHSRAYFQGREQILGVQDEVRNPAFQALVAGIANARQHGPELNEEVLRPAVQLAVKRSLHHCLAANPQVEAIGAVVMGEIGLEHLDQVVVALDTAEEFQRYLEGHYPRYLRPARDFFQSNAVKLRVRPPVVSSQEIL